MLHIIVMFWHRFLPSNITLSLSSFCYSARKALFFGLITKAMNISLSIQKSGAGVSESATRIVMANHQSLFDIVLLFGSINELVEGEKQFVLKETFLKWMPIIGWYCWLRNYPFVNRLTLKQLRANPKLKEQATNDFKKPFEKIKDVKTWIIFPRRNKERWQKKSPYRYLLSLQ